MVSCTLIYCGVANTAGGPCASWPHVQPIHDPLQGHRLFQPQAPGSRQLSGVTLAAITDTRRWPGCWCARG